MNAKDAKKTVRAQALARRDAIPLPNRERRSADLCRRLEELIAPHCDDPVVAVYAAMRSEVSLQPFIDAAYRRGWHVCFPCMVQHGMAFYRVPGNRYREAYDAFLGNPLLKLSHEQLVSQGYEAVEPEVFDAVAVPLVAFDDARMRLGYGGGNYDRFLPRLRADALVVGVAFQEQQVPAVPCEPHDLPLPAILIA